ncbi:MAG: thiamine pyrophosphate-binding protein [Dehalococcoidales bacterium]|nr:thiamine pyrophosphate-binding protein [Dehalococcoidales bacterium]
MPRACEKIIDILIEAGVDYIFGIPGGGTIPIWDALYGRQDKIKAVLCRHEQTAACMADAYGRLTGKPAVLMGQGAFIASNGAFGILESYLYGSPMLVLTDTSEGGISQHGTYQSGTGEYGSFDIVNMMRGMSKYTTYAVTPEEAVHGVQLGIKHAITGRPGPACVIMRNTAITGEFNPQRNPRVHPTAGYLKVTQSLPLPDDVKKVSQAIISARHPVILAGSGVHASKAYDELKELAELLGIPVATSYRGKSAFPEVHPLGLGMIGTFGQKVANDLVAQADLLLIAGCRLSPSDTKSESPNLIDPTRQKIIQIDIDPRNSGWVFPVETSLIGDLKLVLQQLTTSIKRITGGELTETQARISSVVKAKQAASAFSAPEMSSDTSPILPQRIVSEIEKAVDDTGLITLDAGDNRLWMAHFYRSKVAGSVFCPGGVAGMGWGPPAALAVKLLYPDRPVLSVSGDGGFAMVTHVLSTALQYKLPIVFLVMNNSCLGMIRDGQRGKIVCSEFIDTDFAAIARAYGCNGVRIDKPEALAPAIKKAFKATIPTVIDVITSTSEPYFKMASA